MLEETAAVSSTGRDIPRDLTGAHYEATVRHGEDPRSDQAAIPRVEETRPEDGFFELTIPALKAGVYWYEVWVTVGGRRDRVSGGEYVVS